MEILVCVKQVPDADVEVKLNADGKPNVDRLHLLLMHLMDMH